MSVNAERLRYCLGNVYGFCATYFVCRELQSIVAIDLDGQIAEDEETAFLIVGIFELVEGRDRSPPKYAGEIDGMDMFTLNVE